MTIATRDITNILAVVTLTELTEFTNNVHGANEALTSGKDQQ